MKKVITMLMGLSSLLSASATETETPQLPDNVPGLTQVVELTWYEIDPGVRTYLILLSAVTMELSAELPGGGITATPEQQFDLMQKVMDNTPTDSLTGEYLEFIKAANVINTKIVNVLKVEKPTDIRGVTAVTARYQDELNALYDKYPLAARYFKPDAQMAISFMLMQETDIQRVQIQAAMAGKNQKEIMQTVAAHLRRVAADQM